jgi:hypothetical protein
MSATPVILLIVGIAVGFGIAYIIYDPQLSNLQNEIRTLQGNVTTLQAKLADAESKINAMSGGQTHTGIEKLEIKTVYATLISGAYTVKIDFVNTGDGATGIELISLNGIPTTASGWSSAITLGGDIVIGSSCPTGVTRTGTVSFPEGITDPSGNALGTGVMLNISINTIGGKVYYASVILP